MGVTLPAPLNRYGLEPLRITATKLGDGCSIRSLLQHNDAEDPRIP